MVQVAGPGALSVARRAVTVVIVIVVGDRFTSVVVVAVDVDIAIATSKNSRLAIVHMLSTMPMLVL